MTPDIGSRWRLVVSPWGQLYPNSIVEVISPPYSGDYTAGRGANKSKVKIGRCVRVRLRGQHGAQGLLGPGLADRAGYSGEPRTRASARGAAEVAQRLEHVGNDQQRRFIRKGVAPIGGNHRKRARRIWLQVWEKPLNSAGDFSKFGNDKPLKTRNCGAP